MVRQFELLAQPLHMVQHLLQRAIRMLGLIDTHEFHLIKLMQTIQSPHILAITAGLATKASRISAALDRQIFLIENLIAENIRDRHFGRRNQIEIIHLGMIHLPLFIRQLPRSITRSLVYHKRRLYLQIARLACLIQEECFQRTLQARHLTDIHRKTRTGDLNAEIKINQIIFLTQIPVTQGIGRKLRNHAALFHHHIARSIAPLRHLVIGNIGNRAEQRRQLTLGSLHLVLQILASLFQRSHLFLNLIHRSLLTCFQQPSDLFGEQIRLLLSFIKILLGLASPSVNGQHMLDSLAGSGEMLLLQTFNHAFSLFTDEFKCKHIILPFYLSLFLCGQKYRNLP